MSKGSEIVSVRIEPDLLAAIDAAILRINQRTFGAFYERSSFLRTAAVEKLKHLKRSNRKNRRRAARKDGV